MPFEETANCATPLGAMRTVSVSWTGLPVARREEITRKVFDTLRERIQALLPQTPLDSGRIEQEAAVLADRSDVSEELQRLEGHLQQFGELIVSSSGPSSASKRPPFASKHDEYRIVSSIPRNAESDALRRAWAEISAHQPAVVSGGAGAGQRASQGGGRALL